MGSSRPSSLAPACKLSAVALVLPLEELFELMEELELALLELEPLFDDLCMEARLGRPSAE